MIGRIRKHSTTTESTNLDAREHIRKGAREGTVITADFQTRGRGRRERRWISSHSESVLASYILYPHRPMDEWGGIPFLAGLAVVQAVNDTTDLKASLKWPNDVLVNGKKLSGILVESGTGTPSWAIAGIGINVNQMVFEGEYRVQPTSMYIETQKIFDIDTVINHLSHALDEYYGLWSDMGNAPIIEAWKQHSDMMGKQVQIDTGSELQQATAIDVNADGSLAVEYASGETRNVYAGDVTLRLGGQ